MICLKVRFSGPQTCHKTKVSNTKESEGFFFENVIHASCGLAEPQHVKILSWSES